MERIKTCGDCIHADLCEKDVTLSEFNRNNAAYCEGFRSAENFVEVVRCKDCKHENVHRAISDKCTWCEYWGIDPDFDDFCSYGERKDGEG